MRRALVVWACLLGIGCHSTAFKVSDPTQPKALEWQNEYRHARASTDLKGACATFRRLAAEKSFPPRELADLRATEICGDRKQLERGKVSKYLQDIALDISLNLARENQDKPNELILAVEKSKQKLPQSEKLRWLKLARDRATELNDEAAIKDITLKQNVVAPRLIANPGEKDYLNVAFDFRQIRQFAKAKDYFERVIASPTTSTADKITALKGLRLGFKNARQSESHIATADRLVKFLTKQNPKSRALRLAAYEAEIYQARALWTQGKPADARAIFASLETRLKGQFPLSELYWLRARMYDEVRDYDAVSVWLDRALNERTPDRGLRDKILWYAAWNERRRNNLAASAERLKSLDADTKDDGLRNRALFWLGQTQLELKLDREAKATLDRLVTLDPIGYYGLLARRALKEPLSLKTSAESNVPPANLPLDLNLAEWLNRIEESDALTALLDEASRVYRLDAKQNDDGWFTIFKLYARAGFYMKLFDKLSMLTPERRQALLETHPELLFPQPWSEEVKSASERFDVPGELIYSIMRQESAFDPRARSGADAFGLLQLLPEVAESLAGVNQIPYAEMEDLYQPSVNIPVGAAHLQQLFKRYNGQFILAVAAYNASDNAIRTWVKTRARGNALEFIEEIPFDETRTYVRLVMRNLIFYTLLNYKPGGLDFPEDLLKLEGAPR